VLGDTTLMAPVLLDSYLERLDYLDLPFELSKGGFCASYRTLWRFWVVLRKTMQD